MVFFFPQTVATIDAVIPQVTFGGVIEALASKLGLPSAHLSEETTDWEVLRGIAIYVMSIYGLYMYDTHS